MSTITLLRNLIAMSLTGSQTQQCKLVTVCIFQFSCSLATVIPCQS